MNILNGFLNMHKKIDELRRQCIADYWNEKQSDDIIAKCTIRQINYLLTIHRHGPCSLQTVMQHTGLSSSAVSAAVDKLVKAKLVRRMQNKENRREVRVSLYPEIRTHFDNVDQRFRMRLQELLEACSSEEQDAIEKASSAILLRTNHLHDGQVRKESRQEDI